MGNPIKVSAEELLKEENQLRPWIMVTGYFQGQFKYIIQLQTQTEKVYFEHHIN